jgi:hypothetical protein
VIRITICRDGEAAVEAARSHVNQALPQLFLIPPPTIEQGLDRWGRDKKNSGSSPSDIRAALPPAAARAS